MKAIDLINDLRAQLGKVKAQGHSAVNVGALEAYLAAVEPAATTGGGAAATDEALAKGRHDFEEWKVRASLEHASSLEMFKSVIEAGRTALNSLILMNGGAAVALLAFLGNVLSKQNSGDFRFSIPSLRRAMLAFVLGVGFAGASSALRYLSQFAGNRRSVHCGLGLTWAAIAFGIASLCAFFFGGLSSYWAFG